MALGILLGAAAAQPLLGLSSMPVMLGALAFAGGMVWVFGNLLLVYAVASAGMARAFIIVNFTAVFSFFGGIAFLGELPALTAPRLGLIVTGIGLVMAGAFLVGTTVPRNRGQGAGGRGKDGRGQQGSGAEGNGGNGPGTDGARMRRGLVAVFIATLFFSTYNAMIAFAINREGAPAGPTLGLLAPGAVAGAVLAAAVAGGGSLSAWRAAPRKWHLLALAQGLVWAAAMACIMFGWMGTGIAMGTPVQVGTQTLVSSLWGIVMFGELRDVGDRRGAYAKFISGAALTVGGIALITFT